MPRLATAEPDSLRASWSGQRRSASSGVPVPSAMESPSTARTGPRAPLVSTPVRRNTDRVRTPSTVCQACVLRWKDSGPVGPGSRVPTVSRDPSGTRSPATGSLVREAPAASHACGRPAKVTGRPSAVTGPTSTGAVPKACAYRSRTCPPAERRSRVVQSPSVSPADASGSSAVGTVWAVAQEVVQGVPVREGPGAGSGAADASGAGVKAAVIPAAAAYSRLRLAGAGTRPVTGRAPGRKGRGAGRCSWCASWNRPRERVGRAAPLRPAPSNGPRMNRW